MLRKKVLLQIVCEILLYITCSIVESGRTDSTIFPKTSNFTLEFFMGMYSMMKQVKEEIEVISTPDLIGSVGGSLGMFFWVVNHCIMFFLFQKDF